VTVNIHLDFETRSKCDLMKRGAWVYSKDKSTGILCICYAFGDGPVQLSHPAYPQIPARNWPPKDLLNAVSDRSNTVHAHNSFFEMSIWENVLVGQFGWPAVLDNQWRCTLSIAAFHALPRSLDGVSKALSLDKIKDLSGKRMMLKCSKPTQDGGWHEVKDDLLTTFKYCIQDVEVERAVEDRLSPLPPTELLVWQLDQKINKRGILFDKVLAENAIEIAEEEKARANISIFEMTDGEVMSTGARKDFDEWTFWNGYDFKGLSLSKDLIPDYLSDSKIPKIIKDVIELKSSVSVASVNKYKAMINLMDDDNRVRDGLRYYGATTGRWAGKGVQIHNFPRGYGKEMVDVCEALHTKQLNYITFMYDDKPMQALKKATRGAVISPLGEEMLVADYSSVEARGLMWLAGDDEAVKVFMDSDRDPKNHPDTYCVMATAIYGYPVNKKDHPFERQLGKKSILGAGYGMGYAKFFATITQDGIILSAALVKKMVPPDELEALKKQVIADAPQLAKSGINVRENLAGLVGSKYIINMYRDKYPLVKKLWYDVEQAALEAMRNPNTDVLVSKLKWRYEQGYGFLQCELPSGRKLNYPFPRLEPTMMITFTAVNPKGRKIKIKFNKIHTITDEPIKAKRLAESKGYKLESDEPDIWESEKLTYLKAESGQVRRTPTYGGKLVENVTQAVCRDLMAEAMLNAEDAGFALTFTVHDEIACEVKKNTKTLKEFEEILCQLPPWAEGFPISAEGFQCTRYKK